MTRCERADVITHIGPWCYCRQRPTLPHSFPCSTIGGSRLNFRVRNGNGCDPAPMTTGKLGLGIRESGFGIRPDPDPSCPSDVKDRNAARTCGGPALTAEHP